jgi:hypothetical protein
VPRQVILPEQRLTYARLWVWLRQMSVVKHFERLRDLRKRAAEYERAAADPSLPTNVRTRYVLIANHYRVVADGEERAERARFRARATRRIPAHYKIAAE